MKGKVSKFLEEYSNLFIIIGVLFIIITLSIVFFEYNSAKSYCNSIDGDFNLDFFPLPLNYFCDNEKMIKFDGGWGFSVKVNTSETLKTVENIKIIEKP